MAGRIRLDEALQFAVQKLQSASDTPQLDAQTILAHVLDRDRSWLLAHPEAPLENRDFVSYSESLERIAAGEALPYVIGERWFYGRLFKVRPAVLIPRPETEVLIDIALEYLRSHPKRRKAVDVGTGSGCIAATLCAEVEDLKMLALDASFEALKIARQNAQALDVDSDVEFVVGDLLTAVSGDYDLIAANLPYIPSRRLASLDVAKREPISALDGGEDGLDFILRLIESADDRLAQGGCVILEIDETQAMKIVEWIGETFPGWSLSIHQDLAGLDRVVVLKKGP